MVLDSRRREADAFLLPLAQRLSNVNPNTLTWIALLSATLAGISYYFGGVVGLSLALLFVFFNALFDALDGRVAKLTGKASARGDFLDHVLDRYADILVLGGISFGTYCPLPLGFLAVLGVLLASYMGTQAQAVGVGRQYGGLLGRADRLVLLIVVTAFQLLVDPSGTYVLGIAPLSLTFLAWLMVLFAILGHSTALQRALSTWKKLASR